MLDAHALGQTGQGDFSDAVVAGVIAFAKGEYRTKYTAGKKQVISNMLKRLRTTRESAQVANWGNRNFSRIKTLPRILLAAAPHDIFTSSG